MLSRRDDGFTVTRNTIIGIVIAGLVIVGSIVLVLTVFGGNFELVKSK
ncbi:hypothetical protein [Ruminococcus albus]|nr:hypothetical protein [Ruminococcus albus]